MSVMNNMYQQYRAANIPKVQEQQNGGTSVQFKNNNPYQQYQQNVVNTATPQELTLMLYNGLIKFIKLSIQELENKNYQSANNNLLRAQDIICEFISTLDMSYEVSGNLLSMYDYMTRRLTEANIKKDKAIAEEILGFAEELRDTWAQAMKLAKQQASNK